MNESSIISTMKPQDQIIYLLGQIQGEVAALHKSIESSNSRQASINADTAASFAVMQSTIQKHGELLAVLEAAAVPRLTWPQLVTCVAAVGALILSIRTLFPAI